MSRNMLLSTGAYVLIAVNSDNYCSAADRTSQCSLLVIGLNGH